MRSRPVANLKSLHIIDCVGSKAHGASKSSASAIITEIGVAELDHAFENIECLLEWRTVSYFESALQEPTSCALTWSDCLLTYAHTAWFLRRVTAIVSPEISQ